MVRRVRNDFTRVHFSMHREVTGLRRIAPCRTPCIFPRATRAELACKLLICTQNDSLLSKKSSYFEFCSCFLKIPSQLNFWIL